MNESAPVLVVHAGAGEWAVDADLALEACRAALKAGTARLASGASALDAVIDAVRVLEADPVCNAGTGAVLNSRGEIELDASVMDGRTLRSGAVGALSPFDHPVDIARAVLDDGRYHLLVGEGAAEFARERGFQPADPASMVTEDRRRELAEGSGTAGNTVGAIARDRAGHLASATSTGGLMGTLPGRIGDTPIVGAGTYASAEAACSCTGDGEAFARACAAFRAVEHSPAGAAATAESTIAWVRERFGGSGGLILLDAAGEVGVASSATRMPYGVAGLDDQPLLAVSGTPAPPTAPG